MGPRKEADGGGDRDKTKTKSEGGGRGSRYGCFGVVAVLYVRGSCDIALSVLEHAALRTPGGGEFLQFWRGGGAKSHSANGFVCGLNLPERQDKTGGQQESYRQVLELEL